jgi:hypothetical protein
MPDDALGLIPTGRLAHAECALAHMLGSPEPRATDPLSVEKDAAEQRCDLPEHQWETLLGALLTGER